MKLNTKIRATFLLLLAGIVPCTVSAATVHVAGETSTLPIIPGTWNTNFQSAKAWAEQNARPLLILWSNKGCGICNTFKTKVTNIPEFQEWAARQKLVMVSSLGVTGENGDAYRFIGEANAKISKFPFIGVYWKDGNSTNVFTAFSGLTGLMPSKGGTLFRQFTESVEKLLVGYTPPPDYTYAGGIFVAGTDEATRLEGFPGKKVQIPLKRQRPGIARNSLLADSTNMVATFEWQESEQEKFVDFVLPEDAMPGTDIQLALTDESDPQSPGRIVARSLIRVLSSENPLNALTNPAFGDEPFGFGEWTMNLDAATNLVAATEGSAFTLVYVTGAKWCPYCIGFEKEVLQSDWFKAWSRDNRLALVLLDNPKRSVADHVNMAPFAVSAAPDGDGPSLLTYETGTFGSNGKYAASGAGYLSRKGISVDAAKAVLKRNHELGYLGGALCPGGQLRTPYPALILLGKDGVIRGRVAVRYDTSAKVEDMYYPAPFDENRKRLECLLSDIEGYDEMSLTPGKTQLRYVLGDDLDVPLTVNRSHRVYQFAAMPGRIDIKAESSVPVTISLVRMKDEPVSVYEGGTLVRTETLKKEEVVASSDSGLLSHEFTTQDTLFLKVSAFGNAAATDYGDQPRLTAKVRSSVVLIPQETAFSEFLPTGATVCMSLVPETDYKLEGFDVGQETFGNLFSFDAERGVYTAKVTESGLYDIPCTQGERVKFRIWKPGVVSFVETGTVRLNRFSGTATFKVVRSNGTSGAVACRLDVVDGDASPDRYSFDVSALTWKDGEGGVKTFSLRFTENYPFTGDQTVRIRLGTDSSETTAGEEILSLVLTDTDKPVLGTTTLHQTLYTTFDGAFDTPQYVYNVQGKTSRVKIKKIAGALPSGVKLSYDKETGCLALSGSPRKRADTAYTFALVDERGIPGPNVTIDFTVREPVEQNAMLSRAITTTLPVFEMNGNGKNRLVGTIQFSTTSRNKISAKYTAALTSGTIRFSGKWKTIDEQGTAWTTLVKNGRTLEVSFGANGVIQAQIQDMATSNTTLVSPGIGVRTDGYGAFAGTYTTAFLPIESDSGSLGAASGTISLTSTSATKSGRAKFAIRCPDGKSYSGSANLGILDVNFAVLPILKVSRKAGIAVPVKVRINAVNAPSMRALVMLDESTAFWWNDQCQMRELMAFGSFYAPSVNLLECCGDQVIKLFFDKGTTGGGANGALITVAGENTIFDIAPTDLKPVSETTGMVFTFKYKTGQITGGTRLNFTNKQNVRGKFYGVVLPGWFDCGCVADTDELIPSQNIPFAMGACVFSDRINGKATSTSIPFYLGTPQN